MLEHGRYPLFQPMSDVLLLSAPVSHTLRMIEVGLVRKPGATLGISLRRILIGSKEGVLVDELEKNSVAAAAKTIRPGNLIYSINGVKPHDYKHAAELLRMAEGEVRLVLTLPPLGCPPLRPLQADALDATKTITPSASVTAARRPPAKGSKGSMAMQALALVRHLSTARHTHGHAMPRSEVSSAGSLIEGPMRAAKRAKLGLAHSGASIIHTCLPERHHAIVGRLAVEEGSSNAHASSQDGLEFAPPRIRRTVSLGTATDSVQSLILDPD